MRGSKKSIPKDKLDEICKSLDEDKFKSKEDKEWIKEFNSIPLVIRREIVKLLEKEQTKSIIKSMHELKDNINVPFLGKFSIKPSRKNYIKLCRRYPDKSTEEIVEIVKALHKKEQEKKNKKKQKLNLIQVKNEVSSSS